MTMEATQEEWAAIIDEAEQNVSSTSKVYKAPSIGSTAFAKTIDHTLLKLEATAEQIDTLCKEAVENDFKSVCVRLQWVERAIQNLRGSSVIVACVVGFHEGTQTSEGKATEAARAVEAGAKELDMVINWPLLKKQQYPKVYSDILAVRDVAPHLIILKVILETSQLSRHEIVAACKLAEAARAEFVKTSTGFNGPGATREHVALMKAVVGDGVKVKASGGVKTVSDCVLMMEAGAERIGTSNGVVVMDEAKTMLEKN